MSSEAADASGTWRKGEHVLIGDVLAPVQSSLVWLALVMIAFITGLPALIQAGLVQNSPATGVRLLREPWILQLLTITADLVLLFYLWRIARRVSEAALIARFRSVRRTLLLLAMLGGAALAVGTIFGSAWLVAQKLIVFHPVPGESLITPGPPWQILVSFLAVGIVAPLVEEFYFRGILLSWIARKATVYAAIPASALVFALLHFRFAAHPGVEGWYFTGVIALVGLVNGVLAVVTRSLWIPILFHAGYNSALLGLALLPLILR
jgi:membrane protease YdiL (CAAX protease family)